LSKWTGAAESFYLALLTVCQHVNVSWRATSAKVIKMKLKLARAWYFCKSQIKSEIRVSDIRYNGKNVNVPSISLLMQSIARLPFYRPKKDSSSKHSLEHL